MVDEVKPGKTCAKKTNMVVAITYILASVLISGCAQVPDAVNPVEWYRSSLDFFSGQDSSKEKTEVQKKFPNLRSVDRQRELSEQRAEGLVADKKGRKYAAQVLRQGEAVNVLNTPPAKPNLEKRVISEAPAEVKTIENPQIKIQTPVISPLSQDKKLSKGSVGGGTLIAEKELFSKMAKRLNEIKQMASHNSGNTSVSVASTVAKKTETVVISSSGVEIAGGGIVGNNLVLEEKKHLRHMSVKPLKMKTPGEVKVATILFANSSASLTNKDRSILANVRQLLIERGGKIRIVGHASSRTRDTDPINHKLINFRVSAARAAAVANELVRIGVDRKELQVDAVSDTAPMFYEYMPSGEAGNRRAEIFLVS